MTTTLYLLRHGATAANLQKPYILQGRGIDPELAVDGVRQSEWTRDLFAFQSIDHFYASPMKRAQQTAGIIAAPHRLNIQTVAELTECDVGRWEGLSWDVIRERFPEEHRRFMADPGAYGYMGGESFAEVGRRVSPVFDRLLETHAGETLLVVAHHVVNRVYLASLLGLSPTQARQISLDNCGVSVVTRKGTETRLATLNTTFHLQGAAA